MHSFVGQLLCANHSHQRHYTHIYIYIYMLTGGGEDVAWIYANLWFPWLSGDYCDVYLTHDSMSVRKAHNSGKNHLKNVVQYYQGRSPRVRNILYMAPYPVQTHRYWLSAFRNRTWKGPIGDRFYHLVIRRRGPGKFQSNAATRSRTTGIPSSPVWIPR